MRKWVASCSVVMIAAGALAACGSSGSSKATNPSETTNPGGASSPSDSDLAKLVTNAGKQKFKLTYVDGSGASQMYEQDGKGNSVSGSDDSLTFATATSIVSCDKSSGAYQCTETPASQGNAASPFSGIVTAVQSQFTALGGHFGSRSSKTIAGRDAECVTFSQDDLVGSAAQVSYSGCIDKQTGATLEVAVDDAGKKTTSLLVTKFEEPGPSDFTPPVTPSTYASSLSITLPVNSGGS